MITISDKFKCCGCTSCASICTQNAIYMCEDEQGFLYPCVDNSLCLDCGECERVCPILNPIAEKPFKQRAFLLQHMDVDILRESASGGAFSAVAQCVLQRGGVVFGAAYRDDFSVAHRYVENEEDLRLFRNSKYVQSDMRGIYPQVKRFLTSGRFVCFSGTPCQVEGLLNYLGEDYPFLITVDIVCHAVPSPAVWKAYLNILKARGITGIKNLRFRDKTKYGYLYSQFSVTSDKMIYEGIEKNVMLRAFFSEICNRPSCYDCRFKKQYRRSDVTIWDCFDVSEFTDSKVFDVKHGVSRILFHSEKALNLLDGISKACAIEEIPVETAMSFDAKELFKSAEKNPRYDEFWARFKESPGGALLEFFPVGMKEKTEEILRKLAYRLGIYSVVRSVYKRLFGNRKR